ncbi:MAG: permease-like cell division protein FtsX [Lachnospiraceae bacterium]|nr:permease-like cell division protein FtsX [Lachnospiraceae bacterium]
MKISTFFYTIRQGFVVLFRNKWYTLASIATMSACLLMLGVFYSVVINFQNIVKNVEEVVSFTVFFEEGISQERIDEIGRLIESREEVAEIRYISAEQAWADYQADVFKDRADEFLAGYPDNPLANSMNYEVFPKDVSQQDDLKTYIMSIPGVSFINSLDELAETLTAVNVLISYVSVGIIAVLLAVSVFLISNTIIVGISIRKAEINIMKYVGATDFFVRAPFVIEGVIIGLLGAVIPLFAIYKMYSAVLDFMMTKFENLTKLLDFLPVETIFDFLLPISLIVGVGIGFLGSWSTVKKHLHV